MALEDNDPDVGKVLITADQIHERIDVLGKEIGVDYADKNPLLIAVLKGAFVFMADLTRAVEIPLEVDFMAVSSYGASTRSSGVVRIVKDLDIDLGGRHVLIVEDIVDSGLTLRYLRKTLAARGPASLEVCALMVREGTENPDLAYVGFHLPSDAFVVGYGLDVAEHYRNLRGIAAYTPGNA